MLRVVGEERNKGRGGRDKDSFISHLRRSVLAHGTLQGKLLAFFGTRRKVKLRSHGDKLGSGGMSMDKSVFCAFARMLLIHWGTGDLEELMWRPGGGGGWGPGGPGRENRDT